MTKHRAAAVVLLLLCACSEDKTPVPDTPVAPAWAKVAPEQIAEAKKHGVPVAFENDLKMRFVLIPAGTFLMGSPDDEKGRDDANEALHEVRLTTPYYMQVTEVTNGQWLELSKRLPSLGKYAGDTRPVNYISHYTARAFIKRVNEREESRTYALPTEAQWEHACRAGTATAFNTGAAINKTQANFGDKSGTTKPVGSYAPNRWGLFDIHGNVIEHCKDWLATYPSNGVIDPTGPSNGDQVVLRGGSWVHSSASVRSASRSGASARDEYHLAGLRLVSPLAESK